MHTFQRHRLCNTTDNNRQLAFNADRLRILGESHWITRADYRRIWLDEKLWGSRSRGTRPISKSTNHLGAWDNGGKQANILKLISLQGGFNTGVKRIARENMQNFAAVLSFNHTIMKLVIYGKSCNTHTF